MAISEENIRLIFGLKIKQLRDEQHMSLADLSEKSGVSVSYLNEIEKGKKYPKSDKIIALANALGSSYDQLVSLKLSRNLAPVNELLNSDIIQELPFETFGIDKSKLFDMIANAPAKVTAFISTLLEIARDYNMKQEHFYFASLRSLQEMYDNYFEEIEKSVSQFAAESELPTDPPVEGKRLMDILKDKYKYIIEESSFSDYPALAGFRSIYIPSNNPGLIINSKLTEQQKAFVLAKEIGFQYLDLSIRPQTSSWLKVQSFEQVLNNFYASYFAGALIINKDKLVEELDRFFGNEKWKGEDFLKLMNKFNASSEMFLHRLSSILPKFYGIHQLFFIRYDSKTLDSEKKEPNKELHLTRHSNPFNKNRSEFLYRRWITRKLIKHILKKRKDDKTMHVEAIKSKYNSGGNEYFCISILRPKQPISNSEDCVTLGFVVTEAVKKKVNSLNDESLYQVDDNKRFDEDSVSGEESQSLQDLENKENELKELIKSRKS